MIRGANGFNKLICVAHKIEVQYILDLKTLNGMQELILDEKNQEKGKNKMKNLKSAL